MRILENHIAHWIIKAASVTVIVLSATVAIPLTIKTYRDGGGPWGFGMIGLPILIPLSLYFLFGIAALLKTPERQRQAYIISHLVTFSVGLIILILFPVYPLWLVSIPMILALAGIVSRQRYKAFLVLMIVLGVAANGILLKWELDFHRTLPILQLFQPAVEINP